MELTLRCVAVLFTLCVSLVAGYLIVALLARLTS